VGLTAPTGHRTPARPGRSSAGAVSMGPRALVVSAPPAWREWHPALLEVRDAARRASSISASGLEGTEPEVHFAVNPVELGTGSTATPSAASVAEPAGAAKGPRDVELPPWSKGRYGTAVGRAVHGVLQAIDLATGDGLDQVVAAQCAAEGMVAYTDIVRGCVRSALESGIVRRAATRRHWRESFVGNVLDDGTVVEGFVDLMYREDDGTIVVVDYKTDDIPAAAIGVRTEYYRPQINAYLGCLRASGIPGPRGVLLFLSPVRKAEARNVEHLR